MKTATLCLLVKRNNAGAVNEILLAMKKRGFAEGKWNGVGGKVEDGESIEQAMVRETQEEIEVVVRDFHKVAELTFTFVDNPEWGQVVHTYFCEEWLGEPVETEEMRPQWFNVNGLPFEQMWWDDKYWLPMVIEGKQVKGDFKFKDSDTLLSQSLEESNFNDGDR
ncbi:8-oxo-dGTP diphosphatase [candidate division WWE3 bacterium]|uniref:Oxidized purine nucleoside triphosphate hydrolase n=1 Tax=candidate division WWE3 bacterium TaxID=2053526 RepID=A0A955RS60_UNCKA|nr:8-oxo-dGTP diphosphatase [candidate division WWE3 bacterium]